MSTPLVHEEPEHAKQGIKVERGAITILLLC
jgi:hypothetical protein